MPETIAAIDLGSNAIRSLIAQVSSRGFRVIASYRHPLRLGEDVFTIGKVSPAKFQETEECFCHLLKLFSEYNVTNVSAIATSAMRDATNSQELIKSIFQLTGIQVQAISGQQEAQMIFEAVSSEVNLNNKKALLIDIGGGSTELTIVVDNKVIAIKSFNVGTLRLLRFKTRDEMYIRVRLACQKMLRFINEYLDLHEIDLTIGTGGNFRRLGKIRKKLLGLSPRVCSSKDLANIMLKIFEMDKNQRVKNLNLDHGKADVILPATLLIDEILINLAQDEILLPKTGLKEGILLSMT